MEKVILHVVSGKDVICNLQHRFDEALQTGCDVTNKTAYLPQPSRRKIMLLQWFFAQQEINNSKVTSKKKKTQTTIFTTEPDHKLFFPPPPLALHDRCLTCGINYMILIIARSFRLRLLMLEFLSK